MFRENRVKGRLRAGDPSIGCWLSLGSAAAAEVVAATGYDFAVIDHEHGPGTLADGLAMLRALRQTPCTGVVRVPSNDAVYIKRVLDLGAEGVMVPSIDTPEQARAAVAACLYPPRGARGAAYGVVRASAYGTAEDYAARADDELLVILQIESAAAVEAVPDIAAVPGIDALFLGPYDLSGSIGKLGRFDDPEVRRLLDRGERAILDSGLPYASLPSPLRSPLALKQAGCRLIASGLDVVLLREAARADLAALRGGR
ncbi:HpcH/HpaI aldolase family protein [Arenibaculum pallidiluteum]|uniref:HpcH/HpaI aldolase family protein n=1 Tax=Arenibaculum pallidiluteum TaxID=2812559 RepID=UPI001A9629B0|nr:aldolase/citrate lyase family protein [Arenibaculum pallidiluteum]